MALMNGRTHMERADDPVQQTVYLHIYNPGSGNLPKITGYEPVNKNSVTAYYESPSESETGTDQP